MGSENLVSTCRYVKNLSGTIANKGRSHSARTVSVAQTLDTQPHHTKSADTIVDALIRLRNSIEQQQCPWGTLDRT